MTSTRDLAQLINTQAFWLTGGLSLPVTIIDAREAFGRVDVLITPVGGSGHKWTDKTYVQVLEPVAVPTPAPMDGKGKVGKVGTK